MGNSLQIWLHFTFTHMRLRIYPAQSMCWNWGIYFTMPSHDNWLVVSSINTSLKYHFVNAFQPRIFNLKRRIMGNVFVAMMTPSLPFLSRSSSMRCHIRSNLLPQYCAHRPWMWWHPPKTYMVMKGLWVALTNFNIPCLRQMYPTYTTTTTLVTLFDPADPSQIHGLLLSCL